MNTCKTCRHWGGEEYAGYFDKHGVAQPVDPDTGEPMQLPFSVKECGHPQLLFCERPLEPNGFAVCDGSVYQAALFTAEEFGCVRHEERS